MFRSKYVGWFQSALCAVVALSFVLSPDVAQAAPGKLNADLRAMHQKRMEQRQKFAQKIKAAREQRLARAKEAAKRFKAGLQKRGAQAK